MKWFQHQTDASDDIKIKRLESKFGPIGYAIFFKIVEKVGKEGEKYSLDKKKYPIEFLSRDFGVEKKVLEDCLTFMGKIGLVVLKSNTITLPNMKKYASNWYRRNDVGTTEARRRNDGATTAQEESRIDKIRRENKIPSFKKPFYNGMPIRFSKGKLWCIPTDGSGWLEFVDRDIKIEWK